MKVVNNLEFLQTKNDRNLCSIFLQKDLNAKSLKLTEKDATLEKKNQELASNFVTCLMFAF